MFRREQTGDRKTTLEVDIFRAAGMRLFEQKYVQEILKGWIMFSGSPNTVF